MKFPDLIFLSLENWDEVWRRSQFLCSGLARRFPQSKILFVGIPRDVSNALRRRDFSELSGGAADAVPGYPNITVTRPLKFAPNTLRGGRLYNERMYRAHVRRAAEKAGLHRPLLLINAHSAGHLAGRMGERAVVYDITDDWALASRPAWEKSLVEAQDRRLCKRADLVVVCSEALLESRKAMCKRILLLHNGVEVEHYLSATDTAPESGGRKLPAPVFGYTGTLHEDRVDADLIVALARAFPHGSVMLVGPDYLHAETREQLAAQPNIHLTGPVPYAAIAEVMQQFDVCIVPHLESPFTESLNPIKLWEYLACGKPIVSTNVAGFRDYPQFARIASGAANFITACRQALEEDGMLCSARRAEAARNSWDSRVEQFLAALEPLGVLN